MATKRKTKPAHEPTKATRDTVVMHVMVGTPQADIARVLGIDEKTLRKHYRDDLDLAKAKANARVGGALFNKAIGGDMAAIAFWCKTQMGMRETTRHEHTGPNGGPIQNEHRTWREKLREESGS